MRRRHVTHTTQVRPGVRGRCCLEGNAMSVSAHIAAQRTDHGVPHAVSCRALGVAPSTFYKWHNRPPTPAKRRRAELDVEVKAARPSGARG